MIKQIANNKKGSTVILLTMLIMASIFVVSLTMSEIVVNGLKSSTTQSYSTLAYFAAEAGAERAIWNIRSGRIRLEAAPLNCVDGNYVCFNSSTEALSCRTNNTCNGAPNETYEINLTNGSKYWIDYKYASPTTTLQVFGDYQNTRRALFISY